MKVDVLRKQINQETHTHTHTKNKINKKYLLYNTRELSESIVYFLTSRFQANAVHRDLQGHHGHRYNLAGIGLGGSYPDLWSCVNVDTTISGSRNGATHRISDTN